MATSINTAEIPVTIVASATAASYTVPSDRYAIVKAQVKTGGTLSIGGVVVLGSDTWTVMTAGNNLYRTTGAMQYLTVNAGEQGNGLLSNSSNPNSSFNRFRGDGTGAAQTVNGIVVFSNDTARTSNTAQFKVPAGTVIVGAGDSRYLIELYRIPGSAT
jgi:hypothetical protein